MERLKKLQDRVIRNSEFAELDMCEELMKDIRKFKESTERLRFFKENHMNLEELNETKVNMQYLANCTFGFLDMCFASGYDAKNILTTSESEMSFIELQKEFLDGQFNPKE